MIEMHLMSTTRTEEEVTAMRNFIHQPPAPPRTSERTGARSSRRRRRTMTLAEAERIADQANSYDVSVTRAR